MWPFRRSKPARDLALWSDRLIGLFGEQSLRTTVEIDAGDWTMFPPCLHPLSEPHLPKGHPVWEAARLSDAALLVLAERRVPEAANINDAADQRTWHDLLEAKRRRALSDHFEAIHQELDSHIASELIRTGADSRVTTGGPTKIAVFWVCDRVNLIWPGQKLDSWAWFAVGARLAVMAETLSHLAIHNAPPRQDLIEAIVKSWTMPEST